MYFGGRQRGRWGRGCIGFLMILRRGYGCDECHDTQVLHRGGVDLSVPCGLATGFTATARSMGRHSEHSLNVMNGRRRVAETQRCISVTGVANGMDVSGSHAGPHS